MSKAWAAGSTPAWRRIRAQVLARDGYTCQLRLPGCIETANEAHHVHGRLVTGDDPRYIVASCKPCNVRKGDPMQSPDPPSRALVKTRW